MTDRIAEAGDDKQGVIDTQASANIIAKFIAHTEIGVISLSNTRPPPAEATSPARVNSSGSPAAARDPNASTMIANVTGQENNSA